MSLSQYHLFAIPTSVKDAEMGIAFSELENELGGGYYAQVLFGSENGERYWKLGLPTLTGTLDRTVTGINGETLSWEEYIWDLFCEQKVNGTPFAYQDLRSGNYYLVRFAQKELTFQRMLVKLYTTGLELKQWRISGETVYSPAELDYSIGAYDAADFPNDVIFWPAVEQNSVPAPPPVSVAQPVFTKSGDVISTTSGTLPIVRCSSTTNDGVLTSDGAVVLVREAYLLMKMREATFSNTCGILTGDAAPNNAILVGQSGQTRFFDFGFGADYSYDLDGVSYAESNQQAPMNAWGIVHIRHVAGVTLTGVQLAADRDFAARFAEVDFAYIILSERLYPKSTQREIMEFLSILKAKL